VSVVISPELLSQIVSNLKRNFPKEFLHVLEKPDKRYYLNEDRYTPDIELVLEQILNCQYQDELKRIYLAGKAIELIALRLSLLFRDVEKTYHPVPLLQKDIEKLQSVKTILNSNISDPPSLVELTKQTGLNTTKLKTGFKTLFGRSIGAYLRDMRMAQACYLLEHEGFNVAEACYAVGYKSPSYFIQAFKKRYGFCPGTYVKMKNHSRC